MKNFGRAVRAALAFRMTVAAVIVCALMVGLLWGANIGTVYPFVEVAISGESMQKWVDKEIAAAQQESRRLEGEIARLEQRLADDPADAAARRQSVLAQSRHEAEQAALARSRWLRPYIYRWLPDSPFRTLILVAAALLVGTVVKDLFLIGNNYFVDKLALLATFDLRKKLYRRTLRMELASFGSDGTGELMSRFTFDMENVVRGLRALFGKAIREPLKMTSCLIGAGLICWRLLVVSLVLVPLAAFLINRLARILRRANLRAMEEMSQIYALLEESFQGIKVVKAFTMERHERQRFHGSNKKYLKKALRIARYESLTRPVTELMGIATILVALLCGAYLVLNQATHLFGVRMCDRPLSLPALLMFYGLLSGVSDPARKLSEVFSRLQRAAAASDRIYTLVDRQPRIRDPQNPRRLPRHHQQIVMREVHFSYSPAKRVLEDVNLTIPFGETLAIVGPNGCGKTSLVNLLPRFFDVDSGSIEIDGVPLQDIRIRDLRSQIGLVTQENFLFDDTVFNNIRYGNANATREQVIEAARQAHAHRFIEERLADGYQTVVGPQGKHLSGGQRQRVALARAILRNPAILILDEATSQIDLESEQVVHQVLKHFIRNRTALIITHRMSTLALADRVLVMNAGRIIDSGTHEELLARCRLYSRLYDIQFRESA